MTSRTVYRELATAGLLLASYPIDVLTRPGERFIPRLGLIRDPVILVHGLGGNRANFFAFATYLRMTGFLNIHFFEYTRAQSQSIAESAKRLGIMIDDMAPAAGVHLIGHSLGGTISRRFTAMAPKGTVRSLITIGSPYSFSQLSPDEIAIFGDEDPIVPPPPTEMMPEQMFKQMIVLEDTGHLAILYHPETLLAAASELRLNRE
jgi:pimeloyl-ACP methyl ester carboxylesterase